MQAISTVNDLFARNLTHNLGAWLRTRFEVSLASAEQMTYSEFTERIPEPAYVCSARLEPLDVMGVVQMDLTMAPPIVDLLLGGVGRAGALREPTDIEDAILFSVMEIVLRELNLAWQPVGLKFALDKREMEAQVSRLMPSTREDIVRELRNPHAGGAGIVESVSACGGAEYDSSPADCGAGPAAPAVGRSSRAGSSLLMAEAQFGAVAAVSSDAAECAGSLQNWFPAKCCGCPWRVNRWRSFAWLACRSFRRSPCDPANIAALR